MTINIYFGNSNVSTGFSKKPDRFGQKARLTKGFQRKKLSQKNAKFREHFFFGFGREFVGQRKSKSDGNII